jgi:tetratricopeptide (TPR) repeat protein
VTNWGSALAILAAGIILGLMFVYFFRRRPSVMSAEDLSLRDLQAKRDALVQQIRDLSPTEHDERTRLEIETAHVLRQLDEHRRTSGTIEVEPAPVGDPLKRATMIGFAWGAGSVMLLGGLTYFVMQSATTREANQPPTGGMTSETVRPAEPPPDPVVQQLEAAVQTAPNDLDKRVELAKAYLERDNLMGVFDQTQYVLAKSPDNSRALTYQGLVRMAMGQEADAVGMLERATKIDPQLLDAWVGLAWARTLEGKTAAADAAISAAAKQHPEEKARLDQVYAAMKQQAAARQTTGSGGQQVGGGELPANHPPITSSAETGSDAIHVTLELDSSAKSKVTPNAIVFVFARAEGVAAGPPTAVKRLSGVSFPLTLDLSAADSMMGQPLPPRVRLEARMDSDGNAMTKDANDPVAVLDGVGMGASVKLTLK